jgi:hypothetical protein
MNMNLAVSPSSVKAHKKKMSLYCPLDNTDLLIMITSDKDCLVRFDED